MSRVRTLIRQIVGSSFMLFFLLLTAVSGAEAAAQPQYGGVLRIIDLSEGAQDIGAPWDVSGINTKVMKPVIESLIREDAYGKYHPWLATGWKVDEAKHSVTLSLRKDVKFHDGTDFNAKAVKWCIDQAIAAKKLKGFLSVDVVDEHTARVNLEKYQNNVFNLLAGSLCNPVSPTAFEKKGAEWARANPVGTGPFKFVSFERGNKLTFAKWEGYWQKGRPYLDGIEYLFIRDPMTQQAALRASGTEKVNVLCVTSGEQAAMMKAQGFEVLAMSIGPQSLIPDSANADSPLSKLKVRQAVSHAINRDAVVKARGFGYWKPAGQIPGPGQLGYVNDLLPAQYDPKKAKQLLTEAGYPNGFSIKIYVMPAMVDRDAMVAVQRFLADVGIQAELEFPDGGAFTAIRFKNGWKNGFIAMQTRMLATTNIAYNYWWQTASGQFPPLKRPANLVEKIDSSLATLSPDDKKMQELTRMLADDVTFIPLFYTFEMYVIQPNVRDTGYCEWSSATVNTPETTWLSK